MSQITNAIKCLISTIDIQHMSEIDVLFGSHETLHPAHSVLSRTLIRLSDGIVLAEFQDHRRSRCLAMPVERGREWQDVDPHQKKRKGCL